MESELSEVRPFALRVAPARAARLSNPDLAQALECSDGDRERLSELIDVFVADLPTQMQAIAVALARGDTAALVGPAHSLTGSAGSLSALALRDLAAQLVQAGRCGDLCAAQRLLPQIDQRARALQEGFARWVTV